MKKFEITEETISIGGRTLHRIRALISFGDVKAGDLGGYVEKEANLSHYGDAWVYGDAEVYGNAVVCGDAEVCGNAVVCGDALIKSSRDYYYSFGFGSEEHGTIFFRAKNGEIAVKSGCFYGENLQAFEERVKSSHKDTIYAREYLALLHPIKIHFGLEE